MEMCSHPTRFNIPCQGEIHPAMQIALDETPLMYCAEIEKTLQDKTIQGSEAQQVRVLKKDRRCCSGTPVVNRHGDLLLFQTIWRGKSDRCHPKRSAGVCFTFNQ